MNCCTGGWRTNDISPNSSRSCSAITTWSGTNKFIRHSSAVVLISTCALLHGYRIVHLTVWSPVSSFSSWPIKQRHYNLYTTSCGHYYKFSLLSTFVRLILFRYSATVVVVDEDSNGSACQPKSPNAPGAHRPKVIR